MAYAPGFQLHRIAHGMSAYGAFCDPKPPANPRGQVVLTFAGLMAKIPVLGHTKLAWMSAVAV